MTSAITKLTPHVDQIYMQGYINKASRQSPHAYETLKSVAIAVTSVALAAIVAYPAALAIAAGTALSFTVSYLVAFPVLWFALDLILSKVNQSKHWFDVRAAALILEPKEKVLNMAFFQQFFPYHYHHKNPEQEKAAPPAAPVAQAKKADAAATPKNNQPKHIGVVIGCNYPTVQQGKYALQNCQNDARHIRELWLKADFRQDDITMMLDVPENQGKDIYPSKANIMLKVDQGIATVNADVKQGIPSKFFFHDSGHGTRQQEKVKGTEPDGMDDEMVAGDFQFIGDDEFHAKIKTLDPKAAAFFTFDCCHSGTMMDLKNNYVYEVVNNKERITTEESGDETDYGFVVMLSGCEDKQTSADGGEIHGQGSGAMTAAFWATLEEFGYKLTYRQLLIGVNQKIKAAGIPNQNPQLSASRKINLDDYIFTSKIEILPHIA